MSSTQNLIPPAPLNGGLFTGEPFKEDAPWRSFPVTPCTSYLNHYNLRSANPPVQALFQSGANTRPGNNSSDLKECGVTWNSKFAGDQNFGPFASIMCMPCFKPQGCTCQHGCGGHNKDCPQLGCPIKWVPID